MKEQGQQMTRKKKRARAPQLNAKSGQTHCSAQYAARTFGDSEGGAPLVFQDVKADAALGRDVGVEHLGGETHFRGLERI